MNSLGISNPAFLANLKRGPEAPTPAEEFYVPSDPGCAPPTVYLDGASGAPHFMNNGQYRSAWLDWKGSTYGWTPYVYIDNPQYVSPSTAANTFWWVSGWSKYGSGTGVGQSIRGNYVSVSDLEAGYDLTNLDGWASGFSNCDGAAWFIGPTILVRITAIRSCETSPQEYYSAAHPFGPQGSNFAAGTVGKADDPASGYGIGPNQNQALQSTAPCANFIYKIQDCNSATIYYVEDTTGVNPDKGAVVAFYDASANDYCGTILDRKGTGDGTTLWDAGAYADCATCNFNFGL